MMLVRQGGASHASSCCRWDLVHLVPSGSPFALRAAGVPRGSLDRTAQHVLQLQRLNGGWSHTGHARLADTDCTTVALAFLHESDPHAYRNPVQRGIQALLSARGGDGEFPTYADAPSEACMQPELRQASQTSAADLPTRSATSGRPG